MRSRRRIRDIPVRRWRWRPDLYPLAALPTLRSDQSALAKPGSLRALERPRFDAAIRHTASCRRHFDRARKRTAAAAVSLDDIKRFRQLDSPCPGHPEYGLTAGVETTTGPLGQGCGNSVGMALAARWLGRHFNRPDYTIFDYRVYAVCGDGDMMEGVTSEAASFAGHQMLGNLCWIYDSNRITIEGHTDLAFSDDVAARFLAYGWNVERVGDVNDTGTFGAGD